MKNTLLLSVVGLVFAFPSAAQIPMPIVMPNNGSNTLGIGAWCVGHSTTSCTTPALANATGDLIFAVFYQDGGGSSAPLAISDSNNDTCGVGPSNGSTPYYSSCYFIAGIANLSYFKGNAGASSTTIALTVIDLGSLVSHYDTGGAGNRNGTVSTCFSIDDNHCPNAALYTPTHANETLAVCSIAENTVASWTAGTYSSASGANYTTSTAATFDSSSPNVAGTCEYASNVAALGSSTGYYGYQYAGTAREGVTVLAGFY